MNKENEKLTGSLVFDIPDKIIAYEANNDLSSLMLQVKTLEGRSFKELITFFIKDNIFAYQKCIFMQIQTFIHKYLSERQAAEIKQNQGKIKPGFLKCLKSEKKRNKTLFQVNTLHFSSQISINIPLVHHFFK